MKVVASRADFAAIRADLTGTVALVPTMGALHAGHRALLDTARTSADTVVTTIFVNPLQFGPNEDLSRYPRTLDADLAMCEEAGVDLVWNPSVDDMYPRGESRVRVEPGPLGELLEGASRPGHFSGVLTVVAKFFHLVRPDVALFGQKDYQQFCLISRMVDDLDFGIELVPVPTVREPDGLALSSRNRFLDAEARTAAAALSRALFAGRDNAARGALAVITEATSLLATEPGVEVDYLELRGADLAEIPEHGAARLLVAARVGATRLIDNVAVTL